MIRILLVISFVIFGCSTVVSSDKRERAFYRHRNPVKITIKPGEVERLVFYGTKESGAKLTCNGRPLQHTYNRGKFIAYIPETYFSQMKPYKCRYGNSHTSRVVARVSTVPKEFPSERLYVDKRSIVLSKKDQARVIREQRFLNKQYADSPDDPLFEESFKIPMDSFVTSIYGARRIYNDSKRSQHLGTDFRAQVGTPVRSSNAGRVVVARDLFYTGWTVTVDHGMGIFTIYGHLSELKVREGDTVGKDELLGLSGMSGRVTGPHLHWGVKVNGSFIEGSSLVRATSL